MLLIYLPAVTPRTEYVFDLVLKNELGLNYTITTNRNAFERYGQEKLNYSSARIGEGFFIKASTLLFEKSVEKINIPLAKKYESVILFPNDGSCDMGFDVFAAVFYMVSRYEEYLPFQPDKHGRFKAPDSLAFKNNFLQYPVVNIWIRHYKNKLAEKFPSLQFRSSSFKSIVTYDIDIAYAFKGRGKLRTLGATAWDVVRLKFRNIYKRFNSLITDKDPWNIYDELKNTIIKNRIDSIFFFLVGNYSRYDKNVDPGDPLMTDLITKTAEYSDIGIHPSYQTSEIPEKILIEKQRLEKIVSNKVVKSRQHYLRFTLPGTYNNLLNAGITEDYSMGFADMPGFRAGTCTPFYFYDLCKEKATGLKVFSITCMDANFLYYSKHNPRDSMQIILELSKEVKKAEGLFISVWHNNILSDEEIYKGWKDVHDNVISAVSK